MKRIIIFTVMCLSLGQSAMAGPKHVVRDIASQFKRTFYTDVKAHPLSWGVPLALQFAIVFSDTGSSCALRGNMAEVGPSRFLVGTHPACHKYVLATAGLMTVHATAENWLANKFSESCRNSAANKNDMWWRIDAHTHDAGDCFKWVPIADTIAIGAYEIPAIVGNINTINSNANMRKP
jgi:hypothetical protein